MYLWKNKIDKPEYQKLYKLIEEANDIYQDIELENKTLIKGGCPVDCEKRWNVIKPYIKHNSVILDLGSDCGYFTCKIAEEFPDSLVWSFEYSEQAKITKELLKLKGIKNVVLCNCELWKDFEKMVGNVEAIDTLLALSVFHHHEPLESIKVMDIVSEMIPELIVEFPVRLPNDDFYFPNRAGDLIQNQYSNFDKILKLRYEKVKKIGQHDLGDEHRPIYFAKKDHLERAKICSWFTRNLKDPARPTNNKLIYDNGKWALNRKMETYSSDYNRLVEDWIVGLSCWNILYFNVIYPESKWLQENFVGAYHKLIDEGKEITDIGLQNAILTPQGIKIIDWDHHDPHYNKEFALSEIENSRKILELMKPLDPDGKERCGVEAKK